MFPPLEPTTIKRTLAAYLYQQYTDDENLQALVEAYNRILQGYVDWFVNIGLPIYTGSLISGSLLDWVAQGLYGVKRPILPFGNVTGKGLINTFLVNELLVNEFVLSGVIGQFTTTDDIFKRILTWHIYKGDGPQFSIPWLKLRIMRFLVGVAGTAPLLDNTYPVSISFGGGHTVTITITLTLSGGVTLEMAQVLQLAIASGALHTPFQYAFSVVIINALGPTGLINSAGTLQLVSASGWPTSATGLPAGALWSNSLVVTVVPGIVPNPFAAPVYFGLIDAAQLLALGGGNLPLTVPGVSGQLWNDSGTVKIS